MDKSAIINEIAKDVLFVDCLEERKLDRLDFHDLHVTRIKAALNKALDVGFGAGYEVGWEFAKKEFDKYNDSLMEQLAIKMCYNKGNN